MLLILIKKFFRIMASSNPFINSRLNSLRINAALTLRKSRNISQQNSSHNLIPEYKPIKAIGQGAFGVVYIAQSPDGETVAIKKVLQDPRYKNRELDTLKMLNHNNCIRLKNAFKSRGHKQNEVYLNIVMDFLPMSLHQFIMNYRQKKMYPPVLFIKLFSFQIFAGLHYLHCKGITHRDMKPQNVIIDSDSGELKICDFGSAKMLKPGEKSVSYIASRFYRAPELVFDCTEYTSSIDIWAAGCIIAEGLMAGTPIFAGLSSVGQLAEIFRVLGFPTKEELSSFPHSLDISSVPPCTGKSTSLDAVLPPHTPEDMRDLLRSIFVYNPKQRPTALECMQHPCYDDLFVSGITMPNGRPLPTMIRKPSIYA
ncbi:CMGC family protein kinase [Tritrichomonas foetus]|uniref:CMGC family protein kinase n=1 Tax=Tritrichomonas foetus TaxID=1144522 RepID=A0A1J4L6R1_9EUKA|nr:CMGC family protein kinase [Tritrichomonas foetus]|eukprot:OHT17638.1 CMGC family protein kinase [Tritrichomonas foetus]